MASSHDSPPSPTNDSDDRTLSRATRETPAADDGARGLPARDPARYRMIEERGRGGIGRVMAAEDRELGRVVALKELLRWDPGAESQFMREAQVTARLEHPGIVPVHEAGRWIDIGTPFYTMKLVSGRSLEQVVTETADWDQRIRLVGNVLAVADAIAYAHAEGVIHRDLKPGNVIVGDYGETVVIDWGLAKDLGAGGDESPPMSPALLASRTISGSVLGTPGFMPPEQARGEPVDERADVYALGAILYYVLTGRPPHTGEDADEVLERVRSRAPAPLRRLAPGVPRDLASIVERAMARHRDLRYRGAGELATDLRRFRDQQVVAAHRYSRLERLQRWTRRHTGVAIATTLFVILAVAGSAWFLARENRLRHEAEAQRDRAALEGRRAEAERERAESQTRTLLETQARTELDGGRPHRAAVYLAEALHRDPASRSLRALLARSLSAIRGRRLRLVGHERAVAAVAWSDDGRLLLTGGKDGSARLWDARSGRALHVLPGDDEFMRSVTFSPAGDLAVTVAGNVRIWSVETGELVRTLELPSPYYASFDPSGERLVTGSYYGELWVHDVATGAQLLETRAHGDRVSTIEFAPDGTRFVTAGYDRSAAVWDARSYRKLRALDDFGDSVSDLAFSPDGAHLITAESSVPLLVRDAETLRVRLRIRLPAGARWTRAAFGEGGRTIITASHDGIVRVYHAASGALLRSIDVVPNGQLYEGAVSPDGREIAVVGHDGLAEIWDLSGSADYQILGTYPPGYSEAVYPSRWLSEAGLILSCDRKYQAGLWDPDTGSLRRSFPIDGNGYNMTATDDAALVAVSGYQAPSKRTGSLYRPATGDKIADLTGHTGYLYSVAISADGEQVATAADDYSVRLWDAATGAPERVLEGSETMTAVAFRPGSREVAGASSQGLVIFWDRDSGEQRRTLEAHQSWIEYLEYSVDGTLLLTAGRFDYNARLWDADTGELLLSIPAHTDNLIRTHLSRDATTIATSGMDHHARVWDRATGELMREIPGPSYSAIFAPDGSRLFTSGYNGYMVIWDVTVDDREPEVIAAEVAALSPWRLIDGRLELP